MRGIYSSEQGTEMEVEMAGAYGCPMGAIKLRLFAVFRTFNYFSRCDMKNVPSFH